MNLTIFINPPRWLQKKGPHYTSPFGESFGDVPANGRNEFKGRNPFEKG
jgi:hypothetical protein